MIVQYEILFISKSRTIHKQITNLFPIFREAIEFLRIQRVNNSRI